VNNAAFTGEREEMPRLTCKRHAIQGFGSVIGNGIGSEGAKSSHLLYCSTPTRYNEPRGSKARTHTWDVQSPQTSQITHLSHTNGHTNSHDDRLSASARLKLTYGRPPMHRHQPRKHGVGLGEQCNPTTITPLFEAFSTTMKALAVPQWALHPCA
jgi:hypothetical protein